MLCRKIKPIALIIWSHENVKLKYLKIKFCCFFYAKSNTRVATGTKPNCSAIYELTFRISFYLLNN